MKEEKHMLSIFAKPVSCAFVVAPEKAEAFLHEKSDPKTKEKILKRAKKLEEQMKKMIGSTMLQHNKQHVCRSCISE